MITRRNDVKEKTNNAYKDLESAFGLMMQDTTNSFNINFFEAYFAIVAANYELNDLQRNEVWNRLMNSARARDTDFERRLGAGIIKLKGYDKGEQYLKARGY